MIDWAALPVFKRSILRRLALAQQDPAFQQVFHATRDIQHKLTRESTKCEQKRLSLCLGWSKEGCLLHIPRRWALALKSLFSGMTIQITNYVAGRQTLFDN